MQVMDVRNMKSVGNVGNVGNVGKRPGKRTETPSCLSGASSIPSACDVAGTAGLRRVFSGNPLRGLFGRLGAWAAALSGLFANFPAGVLAAGATGPAADPGEGPSPSVDVVGTLGCFLGTVMPGDVAGETADTGNSDPRRGGLDRGTVMTALVEEFTEGPRQEADAGPPPPGKAPRARARRVRRAVTSRASLFKPLVMLEHRGNAEEDDCWLVAGPGGVPVAGGKPMDVDGAEGEASDAAGRLVVEVSRDGRGHTIFRVL